MQEHGRLQAVTTHEEPPMSSAATTTARLNPPKIEAKVAPTTDDDDRSFGRAIVVGSVLGILAFIALLWVMMKLIAPDWSLGATGIVAIWTGHWCGLFLGGTIAVGRWSHNQGH